MIRGPTALAVETLLTRLSPNGYDLLWFYER